MISLGVFVSRLASGLYICIVETKSAGKGPLMQRAEISYMYAHGAV